MEVRFVVGPDGAGVDANTVADANVRPDEDLLRTLARAYGLWNHVQTISDLPLIEIARQRGLNPTKAARLVRLAFRSPRIAYSILDGTQPADLSVRRLLKGDALPTDWTEQEPVLGYAA